LVHKKVNQLFRKKNWFNKNESNCLKKRIDSTKMNQWETKNVSKTLPAAAGAFVLERRQDFGLLRGRSFQRIGVQPGVWGGGREEEERRKKSRGVSV
jgi:hypothetical protein